ncbi:hypothetical protein [Marininema halotolerans]|uniref:Uncharacterized protein n=1 Tax=Marininema halotolerans TaxID=1155944 RepID=A0A1I6UER5_9BACL|nr:hypothetical protein [Marininema halotolerans]SFS99884.1 hypothetical protein SAMN05444972_1167 [Marininema halotolerans]
MNSIPNTLLQHRKKIFIILVGLILILMSPLLASWSDRVVLPILANNNIFGLTNDLVDRTSKMATDTQALEKQVAEAESAMSGLDQQNSLLKKQLKTNSDIQSELNDQLSGNVAARKGMSKILNKEDETITLTKSAAVKGDAVTKQMKVTATQLQTVASYTGKLGVSTAQLNEKLSGLISELDRSVDNFHFIKKIKDAWEHLKDKLKHPFHH